MFRITKNWYNLLLPELTSKSFKDLQVFLTNEYKTQTIYPTPENVFNALNLVKYEDVKVVIIGQDPYHQPNQAHGLSFSVQNGIALPPSLKNIYKEIESDTGKKSCTNGDLTLWAKQGVLLLNSVLTVRNSQPNSHKNKGWEQITSRVVELLNNRETPVVFLLWGANAINIGKSINKNKHLVLTSVHPSPLSAYNGFFGCKHFTKANDFLLKNNKTPITW